MVLATRLGPLGCSAGESPGLLAVDTDPDCRVDRSARSPGSDLRLREDSRAGQFQNSHLTPKWIRVFGIDSPGMSWAKPPLAMKYS